MTHRTETILAAITGALTGLTTTGTNAQRFRAWPLAALPALTILKGADQVVDDDVAIDVITRQVDITVRITVKGIGNLEISLNQIAVEIFAALKADYTLGLAYVHNLELISESTPAIEDQDEPVAMMDANYQVTYEHSAASAEA